jgi:hypothetical protein
MSQPLVSLGSGKKLAGVVAVLALAGVACGRRPATRDRGPARFAVLVDVSASIGQSDVPRWRHQLGQRLAALSAGDALSMYAIGRRSADAAPLVEVQLREARRERGRSELNRARKEVAETSRVAQERFAAALARPSSAGTDIFGALGRVPARTTDLIVFSDMLHSGPGFDMERLRLSSDQVPHLVTRLVEQGRIRPDTLAGTRVWVYLTAVSIDERRRAMVDRAVLRAFWLAVFEKCGASVEYFDNGDGQVRQG